VRAPLETPARPTVALIVESRHLGNASLRDTRHALRNRGCRVRVIVPDEERLFDVPTERPPWDAVLSRGRDLAGLGYFAAVAALGVLAVNSPAAIELVRNKVAMQAVLLEHGLPLPRTWFAGDAEAFERLGRERFPLVVKPFDGDGAQGLALLTCPEDVARLPEPPRRSRLYLAQELLVTDGWDLKLYGIGSRVWAVRKPSPVSFPGPGAAAVARHSGPPEPVALDGRLRDLALTCGRACGLELWGVDVAMTPAGPYVIEVNDFPTYSAIPGAGEAIAEHVLGRIELAALGRSVGRQRMLSIVRGAP
jgi:glutathione synthase/RimK-type ligase-like ATP-grasp enzyme